MHKYIHIYIYTVHINIYTCPSTIHGTLPKLVGHHVPGGFNWSKFLEFLPNCRLVAPCVNPEAGAQFSDGPTDSRFKDGK